MIPAPLWQRVSILLVACQTIGCSMGDGQGEVRSDSLFVEGCMDGKFNLAPSFFSGVPSGSRFLMRIQRGADLQEMSDGLSVLVDDVHFVEQNLGVALQVGLPSGVNPPGAEPATNALSSPVHMALYLHKTCRQQISTLYALRGVIVFEHIFNADPYETNPEKRLTSAKFDVVVGRLGSETAASSNLSEEVSSQSDSGATISRLNGWFQFYFERGQPGQPFP